MQEDIFATRDLIVVPMFWENHWISGYIDLEARKIDVYDSLNNRHRKRKLYQVSPNVENTMTVADTL